MKTSLEMSKLKPKLGRCTGRKIDPVAIDSAAESRLLLGIANWLALRLSGREALWRPEPTDLADNVRLMLRAYRGYFAATTPRLRVAGMVMDARSRAPQRPQQGRDPGRPRDRLRSPEVGSSDRGRILCRDLPVQ